MNNITGLLLGAGASCELAMPLVWELTNELKHWLTPEKFIEVNKNWRKNGFGYSIKSENIFCSLLKKNDLHYENIIGALEVEIIRSRNNEKHQNLHGIREWLLEIIYYLFYYRQIKNKQYIKTRLKFYNGINELVKQSNPLWIFSLNHDLLTEIISSENNIPVKSGFNSIIDINYKYKGNTKKISFEYISKEDIKQNKYKFFNVGEFGINLIKLHGSIDIFGKDDELNYIKLNPEIKKLDCIIDTLIILNDEVEYRDEYPKATNHIMYLDENNELQFLRRSLLSGMHKFDKSKNLSQVAPLEFLKTFESNINYTDKMCMQ